jgi:hypothetical protein
MIKVYSNPRKVGVEARTRRVECRFVLMIYRIISLIPFIGVPLQLLELVAASDQTSF